MTDIQAIWYSISCGRRIPAYVLEISEPDGSFAAQTALIEDPKRRMTSLYLCSELIREIPEVDHQWTLGAVVTLKVLYRSKLHAIGQHTMEQIQSFLDKT